eukprot:RCo028184
MPPVSSCCCGVVACRPSLLAYLLFAQLHGWVGASEADLHVTMPSSPPPPPTPPLRLHLPFSLLLPPPPVGLSPLAICYIGVVLYLFHVFFFRLEDFRFLPGNMALYEHAQELSGETSA